MTQKRIRPRLVLLCLLAAVAAVWAASAVASAQSGGDCYAGLVVGPGESCTYPGTAQEFSVDASGRGHFIFASAGTGIDARGTTINGFTYNFKASKQPDGTWLIEVAGTTTTTTTTTTAPTTTTMTPVESAVAGYSDVAEGTWYTDAVQWSVDNGITGIAGPCFGPNTPVSRGETALWIYNMENQPDAGERHSFTDVSDASLHDAISWMSNTGITTGTSATTFAPDETLKRAQTAAFLHRLAGEPPAPPHSFTDVVAGWQQAPVSWMSDNRITTGTSATTFAPEDMLTRAHLVTFLYRYQGEPEVTVNATAPHCDPVEPDLGVGSPTVNKSAVSASERFTLSAVVRNSGDAWSAPTTLRYYRSTDATITTGDTEVGTDSVFRLDAQETEAESINLTAPSTPGTYYYGACVDSVSNESDTTNNCSASVEVTVSALTDEEVTASVDECSRSEAFGRYTYLFSGEVHANRDITYVYVGYSAGYFEPGALNSLRYVGPFGAYTYLGSVSAGESESYSFLWTESTLRTSCDVRVVWRYP